MESKTNEEKIKEEPKKEAEEPKEIETEKEVKEEKNNERKDDAGDVSDDSSKEEISNPEAGSKAVEAPENKDKLEASEIVEIKKPLLYIENLLIDDADIYLENGVHLGLKYKTSDMRPFIFKIRTDKLCIFDIAKIDQRIRTAAKFLSRFDPKKVLVVSNRLYGKKPAEAFSKYVGFNFIKKRFPSGMLTNPDIKGFSIYDLIIVTDPLVDQQAIKEAAREHIPVLAICDTNTRAKDIDFILPGNNKGKNSLALIYWLLTREILKIRGIEFNVPIPRIDQPHEFVSNAEPQEYLLKIQELQRIQRRKKKKKKGSRNAKKTTLFNRR